MIDFAAHAASLGAIALNVASIAELESAVAAAKANDRTTVLVIETDPQIATKVGGHWWDVPVPQVSPRAEVNRARRLRASATGAAYRELVRAWSCRADSTRLRLSPYGWRSGYCHPARASIA